MTQAISVREPVMKKFCPFLQEPFDACYCMKMGSQNIEKMLYFCGKNFKSCEIFKRKVHEDRIKKQELKASAHSYNENG